MAILAVGEPCIQQPIEYQKTAGRGVLPQILRFQDTRNLARVLRFFSTRRTDKDAIG